jgi:hypothetical protein
MWTAIEQGANRTAGSDAVREFAVTALCFALAPVF